MNIKRFINRNNKAIWYVASIVVFILFCIKGLDFYYQRNEKKKQEEVVENTVNNQNVITQSTIQESEDYVEKNPVKKAMDSFVEYCNNRELEKAYLMLSKECKNAMFPTIEMFESLYINNIYKIPREYELVKWFSDGEKVTYKCKLYGDMLATGNIGNYTEEYCTFIIDENGNYKINVNNYIYGETRNIERTVNDIVVKIETVDVYADRETAKLTITNNSSKTICLTGNAYGKNIYLRTVKDKIYSSFNSKFDTDEIILEPNSTYPYIVNFKKTYNPGYEAQYLILSDVILDYEEYLKSEDKTNYSNKTNIEAIYKYN